MAARRCDTKNGCDNRVEHHNRLEADGVDAELRQGRGRDHQEGEHEQHAIYKLCAYLLDGLRGFVYVVTQWLFL